MSNLKTTYELYLASKLIEDKTFDKTALNVTSSDAEFREIFGNNVLEKYKLGLHIFGGELMYSTTDATEQQIVAELNMETKTIVPDTLQIGDLVAYTPTVSATRSYIGATYVENGENDNGYTTYIESTTLYTPGTLKWVYLGQDENGNALLTSQEATSFKLTIAGQDGFVTGPDRLDTLCNTLYGNSTYGVTRNMKIEDVNRLLEYNGPLGTYFDEGTLVTTEKPMTFEEIETAEGVTLNFRETPRLSAKAFEDYLSDDYYYTGTKYKADTTDEYKVIFKKADGTTNQSRYWLSSSSAYVDVEESSACFYMRYVNNGEVESMFALFISDGYEDEVPSAIRPVIVLNSNIQFGDKNSSGEWTLVDI